jgi:hypothetical protein
MKINKENWNNYMNALTKEELLPDLATSFFEIKAPEASLVLRPVLDDLTKEMFHEIWLRTDNSTQEYLGALISIDAAEKFVMFLGKEPTSTSQ